jgi:putative molybdopterin biosynthesis protein
LPIYLEDIPLTEAQSRFESALRDAGLWRLLAAESVALSEAAAGRVLAAPIWANSSSPHYHSAAMDGFAVSAEASAGAQPSNPVTLKTTDVAGTRTNPDAAYVDTGDPLPWWANAVLPIEQVEAWDAEGVTAQSVKSATFIRIRTPIAPWANVRPLGEDIVATQLVLPAGQVLRPVDLGAIAAAGLNQIVVAKSPRVAIIPTGSELVPIGMDLARGQIREFNSLVMAAQVESMGGKATRLAIVPDEFAAIATAVREATRNHDLILLNAGSSAGSEDLSAKVIDSLGTVLVHGVAVRPGHPVILGMVKRSSAMRLPGNDVEELGQASSTGDDGSAQLVPIVGVPGFPVSAALTVDIFVEPLLARWQARAPLRRHVQPARLTRKVTSPPGDADYLRVSLGRVNDVLLAAPLSRAAGTITSLVHADGLVVVPPGVQGIEADESVDVQLLTPLEEINQTIFCIGSHDLTLDIITEFLMKAERRLTSANVGSVGGLLALRRGHAHVAGSHLLDPDTGEFNVRYVRQYLPGRPVKIVALVGREQGLVTSHGNPKNILSLRDLLREEVLFMNRQRGSGTRVLLDYHLDRLGISPAQIRGYNQEEYTHLSVAAAIAGGRADCGLAVAAAARALQLEFVPLFKERYDLIVPAEYVESTLLSPLWHLLETDDFRRAVGRLPGYDVSVMGDVILEDT